MGDSIHKKIASGMAWTYMERITAQIVSLIVSIVLARLLEPKHFGIIAIVTIFITFSDVFISGGFGNALVQKKDADELDFNSIFYLSFTLAWLLYAVLYFAAPHIAEFYEMQQLTAVIRVMSFRLPLAGINTMQLAYIQRNMQFKKFFFATVGGTVISAVVGITMAYQGFGIWALVTQYLVNTTINTAVLFCVDGWRPRLMFSLARIKQMFGFAFNVLLTQFVFTLESDIRDLIIGKKFGSTDLAFFSYGKKFPMLIVTNLNSSLTKVLLPAFSGYQDDRERIRHMLERYIGLSTFILCPLLIGMMAVSRSLVSVLLTDKWLDCIPFMQIYCIVYLTRPFESACHQAILAIGDSDAVLRIILIVNIISLIGVLLAVFYFRSVLLIAWISVLTTLISTVCFMWRVSNAFKFKVIDQFKAMLPALSLSVAMGLMVYTIQFIGFNNVLTLFIQVLLGATVYIVGAMIFRFDSLQYFLSMVKKSYGK